MPLLSKPSPTLDQVSAYVANLAAFLTRPSEQFVGTVAGVIKEGKKICAHPVLKDEMKIKWPDASFVFHASAREFRGVVEDYDAGKCDVLAVGREDTMLDGQLMEMFCQRDLVFTDSIFLETPIAFAVRPELGEILCLVENYQLHSYLTVSMTHKLQHLGYLIGFWRVK